jgi:hypothetical protein
MGMNCIHTFPMKTAISLPDELFLLIDKYARRHRLSRSEVFARAAREYFEKRESAELLSAINRACDAAPETGEEMAARAKGKKRYAGTAGQEKW